MVRLFQELKRRNVVRVGIAYVVLGWVAIQIAELLFEAFGTPDWVIKTLIVLVAIGFPFALLFAWAFELTPDGIRKTRDVDVTVSVTASTGRKLDFVIIGALAIALGYFIWERQAYERPATVEPETAAETSERPTEAAGVGIVAESPKSIAVLPFVNMSSDQEQEWFADGLTEEILNALARTPDLLVSARTSSFAFKGSSEPIAAIASVLGVEHILEGSVRRGGDRLRITAQLIRADDGFHLWSETFDRKPEDVIAIQEEIAVEIAKALETAMDPEALEAMMSAGTSSVAAYEAYLTARGAFWAAGSQGDPYEFLAALEGYEKAVTLDPEFAAAHFGLDFFWSQQLATNQLTGGITDLPAEEMRRRRDEALENAIRFENDPITLLKYRSVKAIRELDLRRALRLIDEFLAERPNAIDEYAIRYEIWRSLGMHAEVTADVRERFEAGEFSRQFANMALQSLRTPEASELMRALAHEAIEKFGDDVFILYQAHRQLLWASDIDGASRILPRIMSSDLPEENRGLVSLRQACAEGRTGDALKLHRELTEKFSSDLSVRWLASSIVGDEAGATAVFAPYDADMDFEVFLDYLPYPQFDPTPYPNFMRAMADQGLESRPILELPYRCPQGT
ncbi:MAG: hypothetical protein OEY08_13200 [Gammaproteobacteria bacterium]|nr:hypothetical protein [Gammaproteobacteria bacterium]